MKPMCRSELARDLLKIKRSRASSLLHRFWLRRRIRLVLVDGFNAGEHFIRELQVKAGDVALQLFQSGRADDVAGYERLLVNIRQGHLRRV